LRFPWVCWGVGDFLLGMKGNRGSDSGLFVDDGRVGLRVFSVDGEPCMCCIVCSIEFLKGVGQCVMYRLQWMWSR